MARLLCPPLPPIPPRLLLVLTGHVKPKLRRTGLVKELSGMASGTWKELKPSTGVTAPPYVHGGSGEALGW